MDTSEIEMSSEAFAAVNVPVSVFSVILNIMFIFCMVFPLNGTERLKQPLPVLLALLIGCNIAAHICILVMVFNNVLPSLPVLWCGTVIALYAMLTSVNSSHWLNVYYCFRIIPVQHPYLIWLRRNIRIVMYSALIINGLICLLGMSVNFAGIDVYIHYGDTANQTTDWIQFENADKAEILINITLFCLSLCVMFTSSFATVVFLRRHLKNMEMSSGSFSHRQAHISVTIISIAVQAVLHVVCSALVVTVLLLQVFLGDVLNNELCTLIALYSFGTTMNMGISQSLFRQRAVLCCQKLFQPHSPSSASSVSTVSSGILSS